VRVAIVIIALATSGCDLVFGLSGDPRACELGTFEGAFGTPILTTTDPAMGFDQFTVAWDETLAIVQANGLPYQLALPGTTLVPIDLGVYPSMTLALGADGDSLFYSAAIEPPLLQSARHTGDAAWEIGDAVPAGTYAGVPSSSEFGARRILVRLRDGLPDVQEYEEQKGRWVALGTSHAIDGGLAPNLTPDGLAMSYEAGGVAYAATRPTIGDWFGDPVALMAGGHRNPQLFDRCHRLYTLDGDGFVRRYDR
jgi:hypothetical protein